ncbi:MAG TPA: PilZ domain-containing protein [Terriglobales bacterium]|nr:PilZ domain-containing protein [Terriglobales bacterium]
MSLCGTDANGRAFIERVRTANISRDGAFVEGVKSELKPGDIVVLRCEDNTGRFRVVWNQPAGKDGKRIGLSRMVTATYHDDSAGVLEEPDTFKRPRVRARRKTQRYDCEVAAELHIKNVKIPMWVTTMNLGEGGCGVQTVVSVPENTEVNAAFWLDENKIWVQGVVVSSLYGLGTGIRFTGLSRAAREQLQEFLKLRGSVPADRRQAIETSAEQSYKGEDDDILELILPGSPLYR